MIQPGIVWTTEAFEAGQVLLIDKPIGWTSFDVVNKLRFALKVKKIGHAGTLDPMASGLLILCTGKMTKQIDTFQAQEKTYEATFTFGAVTPSFDAETQVSETFPFQHLNNQVISEALPRFTGALQQVPPMYSAIKVAGKRLYELARKGKTVALEPRTITILEFSLLHVQLPNASFRIQCSKGTYIRSLAHDFGAHLGTGAYLSALRRTKIGNYSVDEAFQISEFIEEVKKVKN